jgi:hypothetical protein
VDGIADDVGADVEVPRQAAREGGRDARGQGDRDRGADDDEGAPADGCSGFRAQELKRRLRAVVKRAVRTAAF